MGSSVSSYRQYSKQLSELPIYMRPEWLDIVCPGSWGVTLTEEAGEMASALIFSRSKRYGITWLVKPKLTPFNGIWFAAESAEHSGRSLGKGHKRLEALIADLPSSQWIECNLHPESGPLHAFHWNDFELITRYTYRLLLTDIGDLRGSYKNTLRTDLRQSKNQFRIEPHLSVEAFCQFTDRNDHYRGLLTLSQYQKLVAAFPEHLYIWGAYDTSDHLRAAALFLRNGKEVYYLVGVTDKQPGNTALSMLLDEALHYFADYVEVFDFEGSMVRSVESFFRRFGGTPTPYIVVRKSHPILKGLRRLKG